MSNASFNMSTELQKQLCSNAKLERDKAYAELQKLITTLKHEQVVQLQNDFLKLLGQPSDCWESRHGALSGSKALLESDKSDGEFAIAVLDHALASLDDIEFRVRIVGGKHIAEYLCKATGNNSD